MTAAADSSASSSRLFQPLKLSNKEIHRVAMAPLTRFRAENGTQVPGPLAAEYYQQRSDKGTFILTEATFIAEEAAGYPTAPGIYSPAQIAAWKEITSAVHAKGGVIYCQLWALGRANQGQQEGVPTVSASALKLKGTEIEVKEMTVEDIKRYVGLYAQAAKNAVEAGFDGVEIHDANGYLLDQFLQSVSNKRTDSYGGSIENRARFPLEVLAAVSEAIGAENTGVRFSPWGTFQDMQETNPYDTFGYITREVVSRFPTLGYVHFVEGVDWNGGGATFHTHNLAEGVRPSNDYFRAIVRGVDPESLPKDKDTTTFEDPSESHKIIFMSASGFTRESAVAHSNRTGDVVVFGRSFISTPDLPQRIKAGIDFNKYDRGTFYTQGPKGYTDYPTADQLEGGKPVEVSA